MTNEITKIKVDIACGFCDQKSENVEISIEDIAPTMAGDIAFDVRCPKCGTLLWIIHQE